MPPELPDLPAPPSWSIAVGAIGSALIISAVVLFLLAAVGTFFSTPKLKLANGLAFPLAVGSLFLATAALGVLFAANRFEWNYVRTHSDLLTPLSYRVAAIWSGQQGSFLLWAFMSALFGLIALPKFGKLFRPATAVISLFLAAICAILVFETPFEPVILHGKQIVPVDGVGLAPSLYNYWVIIHPPVIFAGFGSLIVMYAASFAALWVKDTTEWIKVVRPFALVSLSLLGLGLCMGGFWAYETLGWGGFWAWDPVENTSFVPWCLMAMFVHGILVQTARGKWISGNYVLGAVPFLSFLYGTFLTRSGFLGETSVHSFADMNRSALWILGGIGVILIGAFLTLWAVRASGLARSSAKQGPEPRWNRTWMHWLGNFMLLGVTLSAGIGMSVPLIMTAMGRRASVVEEGLYHFVVPYFFLPIMALMAIGPFVGWRKTDRSKFWWKMYSIACFAIGFTGVALLIISRTDWAGAGLMQGTVEFPGGLQVSRPIWVMVLVGFCALAMVASTNEAFSLFKRSKLGIGGFISHFGVGLLMSGLILSRGFERSQEFVVQESDGSKPTPVLNYKIVAGKHSTDDVANRDNRVAMTLTGPGGSMSLSPGLYYTMMGEELKIMTWPAIQRSALHDVYLSLSHMEFDATEPGDIEIGQTKVFENFSIKYLKMTKEGEAGKAGTKFGALLEITDSHSGQVSTVNPGIVLGDAMNKVPAMLGSDYFLTLEAMDAATKKFTLQIHHMKPLYWGELFIKPFTIFVWIGTGILTIGTLLAAFYRRNRLGSTAATLMDDEQADATSTAP